MSGQIARGDLARYGLLALPIAFAGIPLYIHAPDFYATQQGVSLGLIGMLLLALRFIDALQDPLIGRLSDRFARYRLALMLGASALLVAAFAALFQGSTALWLAVTMLLATSAYSVLSVNLNALGGLWSANKHQRTRITTLREAFGLLGLLMAVILPAILQQSMPSSHAFAWVAGVLGAFMLFTLPLFVRWYREHQETVAQSTGQGLSFRHTLQSMPKASRRFFGLYGMSMLASAMPAVLILFFVRDRLNAEAYTGLFLAVYFIAGAAAMPLWQKLSERFGKVEAWLGSMLLAIVSFIWAFFLGEGDVVAFTIICLLSGMAFGADLSLPPSMLADQIDEHKQRAAASTYFSLLTFLLKSAAAIASATVFLLLDWAGLKPGEENSDSALMWLSASYALIPCFIKAAAALQLYRSIPMFKGDNDDDKTNAMDRSFAHVK